MSVEPSPLIVVALGGNAISPPAGELSYRAEREMIRTAATELAQLAREAGRLLIVHGNGPQVGRLLAAPTIGDTNALDIHVAQTQGELGYELAAALDDALGDPSCVAVVTRVVVDRADPGFAYPTKPVGRVLAEPDPEVPCVRTPDGRGWRRVVASPKPISVVEEPAIASLLQRFHVIAGGGGGVAVAQVDGRNVPQPAVVDKDWVASQLAQRLKAQALIFVTDVSHAFDGFASQAASAISSMKVAEARGRLAAGVFAPGSMAPKVESACDFVDACDRPALITTIGEILLAWSGRSGTRIARR